MGLSSIASKLLQHSGGTLDDLVSGIKNVHINTADDIVHPSGIKHGIRDARLAEEGTDTKGAYSYVPDEVDNFRSLIDDAKEHFTYSFNDTGDAIQRSFDDIVNSGGTSKMKALETANIQSEITSKHLDATGLKGKAKERMEKILGVTFSTGQFADDILDMANNGFKRGKNDFEFHDVLSKVEKEFGLDTAERMRKKLDINAKSALDEDAFNQTIKDFRQKHISGKANVDDAPTSVYKIVEQELGDPKNIRDPHLKRLVEDFYKSSDSELSHTLSKHVTNRAFDEMPMDYQRAVIDYAKVNPEAIQDIFHARDIIKADTDELIKIKPEVRRDFNSFYTRTPYENEHNTVTKIMTQAELDDYVASPWHKINKSSKFRIRPIELPDGSGGTETYFKVPVREATDSHIQGSIAPRSGKRRGFEVDMTKKKIVHTEANVKWLADHGFSVSGVKHDNGQIFITKIHQYLSKAEQEMLDVERHIGTTSGETIKMVKTQKESSRLIEKVNTKYTKDVTGENFTEFLGGARDADAVFLRLDDTAFQHPEVVKKLQDNYVRINKKHFPDIKGDYVKREYANQLLGFNKYMLSEGRGEVAKFVEEMFDMTMQWSREAVALKNPVVFVNNMLGGAFISIAGGIPVKVAIGNSTKAFGWLKDMHRIKRAMARQEARGIPDAMYYKSLKDQLALNPANTAMNDGVLKSLIDDGLWDRMIRDGKSTDNNYVKILKNVLMTKDSKFGNYIRHAHDVSDMVFRISAYDYLTTVKGLTKEQALKEVDGMFVNYNKLLPPALMFARDKGITPFVTWFYRMPPHLIGMVKRDPVRHLALISMYKAMVHYMGEEDYKGDDYLGIRTESIVPHNALQDPLGVFNGSLASIIRKPDGAIVDMAVPQFLQQLAEGKSQALGLTLQK